MAKGASAEKAPYGSHELSFDGTPLSPLERFSKSALVSPIVRGLLFQGNLHDLSETCVASSVLRGTADP